jgi:hypothetical protein
MPVSASVLVLKVPCRRWSRSTWCPPRAFLPGGVANQVEFGGHGRRGEPADGKGSAAINTVFQGFLFQ